MLAPFEIGMRRRRRRFHGNELIMRCRKGEHTHLNTRSGPAYEAEAQDYTHDHLQTDIKRHTL